MAPPSSPHSADRLETKARHVYKGILRQRKQEQTTLDGESDIAFIAVGCENSSEARAVYRVFQAKGEKPLIVLKPRTLGLEVLVALHKGESLGRPSATWHFFLPRPFGDPDQVMEYDHPARCPGSDYN